MSSYLSFYVEQENGDRPLLLRSYSRSSDIYTEFYENMCLPFDKYISVSVPDIQGVISSIRRGIDNTRTNLNTDYKILRETFGCGLEDKANGGSKDIYEDLRSNIQAMESYIQEQEETLAEIQFWASLAYDIEIKCTDFAALLVKID